MRPLTNHILAVFCLSFLFSTAILAQELAVTNTDKFPPMRLVPAPTVETTVVASPTLLALGFDLSKGQHAPTFENLGIYLEENLEYPRRAIRHGVEGKTKLLLTISPEGEVMSAEVVESLGHGCDRAALDLVEKMPVWTPASNYGIPVKGKTMVEINFRLK